MRDTTLFIHTKAGEVVAKSARTVSGASAWVDLGNAKELVIQLQADAGTGTLPTLDIRIQTSYAATDATAIDVPAGALTQVLAAASAQIKTLSVMHRYVKVAWTITGTTPSFNFGVYATMKN